MAAFNYEGNTYFYSNGRWLTHESKPVPAEIVEKLTQIYSPNDIKEKERLQQDRQRRQKGRENYYNQYRADSGSFMSSKPRKLSELRARVNNVHKKAIEKEYTGAYELTREQEYALKLLESGANIFLSGEAGTGKSFVINEYLRRTKNKRNVIVCAPTGVAAINIGGATLHRVFNIPIKPLGPGEYTRIPSEALLRADTIIIDEISMCRFDVFEYVIKTIKEAEKAQQQNINHEIKHKQLIVVGDFYQLPPVILAKDKIVLEQLWNIETIEEGFAFQTESWNSLNFQCVVLKEVIRQRGDGEYIKHINKIRKGEVGAISWFNENSSKFPIEDGIYLCGTNKKADSVNREKSSELNGKTATYIAQSVGQVQESDKMTFETLELKVGMQVMTLVNNDEENYQNGSIGKIVSLNEKSVSVQLKCGQIVEIKPYNWEIYGYEIQDDKLVKVVLGNYTQIPLKVAYAITIHKSQGQTYTSANISPDCFAVGQLYVALSRVQNINSMSLEYDIHPRALRVSNSVKKFYDEMV